MKRIRILWLATIPAPYRVNFFNVLGKYCHITVVFEKRAALDRDKSWARLDVRDFRAIFLKGIRTGAGSALCPDIVPFLEKNANKYTHIIISNYSDLTGIIAILYLKKRGIKYWINGDGAFRGSGRGFKECVKKYLISNAYRCLSTCREHDRYYLQYGVKMKDIYKYPFTSINESQFFIFKDNGGNYIYGDRFLEKREHMRNVCKEKIGIDRNEIVILFVGQFIYRKGIDILIESANYVGKKIDNVKFVLIGGQIPLKYKMRLPTGEKLISLPFKEKDELEDYFLASDIFVLPTREDIWGLVIGEALSYSLPTITTDRCNAGLEMIKNGKNGFIFHSEDVKELADRMIWLAKNKEERNKMQICALNTAREYTIEKMAKRHLEVFENVK